jgi:Ca2+ transporting ATPase
LPFIPRFRYGSNKLKERKGKTILEMIGEAFEDTILQILIGAAIVSTIVGIIKDGWMGLVEGGSILMAVVIIVAITTANNYKKEK